MMKILATGMSGLVGTRIQELLENEFEIQDLSLSTGIDITDSESLNRSIEGTDAKILLHLAAKTDVDGCETERILLEDSPSWQVNVAATENIASIASNKGIKIIYISTDFVFDGTKNSYTEDDEVNPVNWYGLTKLEGENAIRETTKDFSIIRIAYPYRAFYPEKKDFVRRILEKIKSKEKIYGVTDHVITPTFIDDIAMALKEVLIHNLSGIYHVVGSQSLTVYDSIELIGKIFGLKPDIIPIEREEYFKGKAFRPFKLSLKNDKITKLGVRMKTLEEGLNIIKNQI
jgi:dTDP-4-dehydrorhamnose reductase